jgi:hypothetical protein
MLRQLVPTLIWQCILCNRLLSRRLPQKNVSEVLPGLPEMRFPLSVGLLGALIIFFLWRILRDEEMFKIFNIR